jgi:hypothetical protein
MRLGVRTVLVLILVVLEFTKCLFLGVTVEFSL